MFGSKWCRRALAVIVVSLSAMSARSQVAPPVTDTPARPDGIASPQLWYGTLDTAAAAIRIQLELTTVENGFTGILRSPDQGNTILPLSTVQISGEDVHISLNRPNATFDGKLSADHMSMEGTWKQGGAEWPLNLKLATDGGEDTVITPKETWKGTLNAGVKLELQLRRIEHPNANDSIWYFDSLTQGVSGLKATVKRDAGEFVLEVAAVQGKFVGKLSDDGTKATGSWSQGAATLPLQLVKTDEVSEAIKMNRPQHPLPPFAYRSEDVSFASQAPGVTLAGTLTMPTESKATGKFTAAIMISGSGPQDRDETIMGHKPFLVIADHLTRKGIAVLRFDDRGAAESTGDHAVATTQDFADDVRGAVAYLRSRPEIDAAKIGLIGHSEGGLIGPQVAAHDAAVAFVVMLAGPGVNGEQIVLNQSPAMARASGESEGAVELYKQQLTQLITAVKQDRSHEQIDALAESFAQQMEQQAIEEGNDSGPKADDLKKLLMSGYEQFKTPWFRFFLTYEPIPTLEKIRCPILSLIGEKDLQVDPKLNSAPIREAIVRAGNPKSAHHELVGLNHLFQTCKTGALDEYQSTEQTFAPVALEMISAWINSLD